MAPGTNVGWSSPLAVVALRSCLLDTEASVQAERDRLVVELNYCKIECEKLNTWIMGNDTAMRAMFTRLLHMDKISNNGFRERWTSPV